MPYNYPYTNMHDLDLDWILEQTTETKRMVEEFTDDDNRAAIAQDAAERVIASEEFVNMRRQTDEATTRANNAAQAAETATTNANQAADTALAVVTDTQTALDTTLALTASMDGAIDAISRVTTGEGPAYALANYADYTWERGTVTSIGDNIGKPEDNNRRVRSQLIDVTNWAAVAIHYDNTTLGATDPYFLITVYAYDADGNYQTDSGAYTTDTIYIDRVREGSVWKDCASLRVIIRNSTDTGIGSSATLRMQIAQHVSFIGTPIDGSAVAARLISKMVDGDNIIDAINDTVAQRVIMGDFKAGLAMGNNGADDTNTARATMVDKGLAWPITGTYKIRINSGYKVGYRWGATPETLKNNVYWFYDGDTINATAGYFYRFSIAKASENIPITQAEADAANFKLYYQQPRYSLNPEQACGVATNRLLLNDTFEKESFTIAHTSDIHGDSARLNAFYDCADAVGADLAAMTGDFVGRYFQDGFTFLHQIIREHKTPAAICTGNHDVYRNQSETIAQQPTNEDVYEKLFAPIAENLGNTTAKTYYYNDMVRYGRTMRIISLNLYEEGAGNGVNRWKTHFSDEQISFLIDALNTAPENSGIVLLYHSPQTQLTPTEGKEKFYQKTRLYNDLNTNINGDPIADIVDAFNNRTTINKTYTQTTNNAQSTLTVTANFAGANGVFVAHLTGHEHEDSITYLDYNPPQLMLNVTCNTALYSNGEYKYYADISDTGRQYTGPAQIAANVYSIDLINRTVKVQRIGNSWTIDGEERNRETYTF